PIQPGLERFPLGSNPASHRSRRRHPRVLGAAFLVALLGLGLNAPASELKDPAARSAPGSAHQCKCGMACRGKSCGCGSEQSPAPADDKGGQQGTRPARDAGPCMAAAPCGGAGLPGPSAGWSGTRTFAIGPVAPVNPPLPGRYLVTPTSVL